MGPRQGRKIPKGASISFPSPIVTGKHPLASSLFTFHFQVASVAGTLSTFVVEPFLPHPQSTEAYVCITSSCLSDTILFSPTGGINVGDVDAHASRLEISISTKLFPTHAAIESLIGPSFTGKRKDALVDFIVRLYNLYADLRFAYLEISPLVALDDGNIHYLDMAAKLDQQPSSSVVPNGPL